jgi:hypothetical protein
MSNTISTQFSGFEVRSSSRTQDRLTRSSNSVISRTFELSVLEWYRILRMRHQSVFHAIRGALWLAR